MIKSLKLTQHDLWFREEVTKALIYGASPDAKWVNAEDVRLKMKLRAMSRKVNKDSKC